MTRSAGDASFATGLALFVVASAGCGLATGPGVLVAFRLLQGAAGGLDRPERTVDHRGRLHRSRPVPRHQHLRRDPRLGRGERTADRWLTDPIGRAGAGMAQRLSDQRAHRDRRPVSHRGRGPPVPGARRWPDRPDRDRHPDRRPDGRGAAPRRRPAAGVAGMDVDEPGSRAGSARDLRRAPGPLGTKGWIAPAQPHSFPGPDADRRARHAVRSVVRASGLLSGTGPVPTAGPRARSPRRRPGVHDPGRGLPGGLPAGSRARPGALGGPGSVSVR